MIKISFIKGKRIKSFIITFLFLFSAVIPTLPATSVFAADSLSVTGCVKNRARK